MTSYAEQIGKIAAQIASETSKHASHLKDMLAEVELRKAEIEAQLHATNLAHQRLSRFVPIRGGDLQCPRCWIASESVSSLRPVAGGTPTIDLFRCNNCDQQFDLQFGD